MSWLFVAMLSACRCDTQGTAGEDTPAELDTLLASVLQDAGERERSLMERVQRQQLDLQALIGAAEQDTHNQQGRHACLEQMQARLCICHISGYTDWFIHI